MQLEARLMAHAAQTRIDRFERVVGVVAAEGKRGSHLENIAVAAHESHQNAFSADRAGTGDRF
jgi:hypothetical protein